MGEYTTFIEEYKDIDPEDDNYLDILLNHVFSKQNGFSKDATPFYFNEKKV